MTHRIFIAINLPLKVKEKLGELILKLKKENKRSEIKWADPAILHLTLHFLGDLEERQIDQVKLVLEQQSKNFKPIQLSLGLIGAFPGMIDPKVIFVEAQESTSELIKLVKDLGRDLASLGFQIDHRPWQAHITLGRVKRPSGKLVGVDHQFSNNEVWLVQSLDLMESVLGLEGPKYQILASYQLSNN